MFTKVIAIRNERIASQKAAINSFMAKNKAAIQSLIQNGAIIPLYNALKAIDGSDSLKDQLLKRAAQNFNPQLEIQILEGDEVARESLDKLSIEESNVLAQYNCPNKNSWIRAKEIRSVLSKIDITNNNKHTSSDIDNIRVLLDVLSPAMGDEKVVTYGVGRHKKVYTRHELLQRVWEKVPTEAKEEILANNPRSSTFYSYLLSEYVLVDQNQDVFESEDIGEFSSNVVQNGRRALAILRGNGGLLNKYMDSRFDRSYAQSNSDRKENKYLISKVEGFQVSQTQLEEITPEVRDEIVQNYDLLMDMYNAISNVGGFNRNQGLNYNLKYLHLDPLSAEGKKEIAILKNLVLSLTGMKSEIEELRNAG